jgi:NhaA family Na+:H+ antiporter
MNLTKYINTFFKSEKSTGIVLIIATIFSLIITNSNFGKAYQHFWQIQLFNESVEHWINDGLMTIFFLLVGLELKRELFYGELSNKREAMLPILAAIGGMLVPACIYIVFNFGTETQSGFGIPMATDIAFSLGILSLLGKRVPVSLKIFLTALAVIDDLGAIAIIGFFYTTSLIWMNLFLALGIYAVLIILNKLKVNSLFIYLIGGICMWYFMLHSGIHATITGVLLAFVIPFENGSTDSKAYSLQTLLHKPVSFFILPIFALANTSIFFNANISQIFSENYTLGIALGLILGKPIGIFLFTYLATVLKLCQLPKDLNWRHIFGIGSIAGIGFTMSVFITILAFKNETVANNAKLMVLIASLISGSIGFIILSKTLKRTSTIEQ